MQKAIYIVVTKGGFKGGRGYVKSSTHGKSECCIYLDVSKIDVILPFEHFEFIEIPEKIKSKEKMDERL